MKITTRFGFAGFMLAAALASANALSAAANDRVAVSEPAPIPGISWGETNHQDSSVSPLLLAQDQGSGTGAAGGMMHAGGMGNMGSMSMQAPDGADPQGQASVYRVGELEISGAYSKAMLPGQPVGGGYLTVKNNGATDDVLLSATSPDAGMVEIHEMAMQGQVMKMRKVAAGVVIPAGQAVALAPGGLHLMFMQVVKPFKDGDQVPVTLKFQKTGSVDVVLAVSALGPAPKP